MNSAQSQCRLQLDKILTEAGVFKYGIASAEPVDENSRLLFEHWIDEGKNAGMQWMQRYSDVRSDPRMLLEGARSIVICAFPYSAPCPQAEGTLRFASYALGDDYHDVIRKKLKEVGRQIKEQFGGEFRVCIDTAPLRERYWAVKAGLGFIGRNCQLIVPEAGSRFFIGTLITDLKLPADSPCIYSCLECGKCVASCPGNALKPSGVPTLDSRKCLSYLSIEHKGDLPAQTKLDNNVYGCDVCQNVCPLNSKFPNPLKEFLPRPELLTITPETLENMTEEEYRRLTRNSAIRRLSLTMLKRNLQASTFNRHM